MLEELKARAFEILTPMSASGELYFLLDGPQGMRVRRVALDRELQKSVAARFIGAAYLKLVEPEADHLIDVTAADDRSSVIYRYDIGDIPPALEGMSRALQGGEGDYDSQVDDLSELEAIIVVLGQATAKLAIYQHHYPVSLIKPGSSINIFRPGAENRFSELKESVIRISAKMHFASIDGEIYILDLKVLERLYGFKDAIENVATVAIDSIIASGILENASFLGDRGNELPFLRKLAQVARKSPVLNVVDNSAIIQFVMGHRSLSRRLKPDPASNKFKFTSRAAQNSFLELLSDNFLRSELTQKDYEARAKDEV